MIRNAHSRRLPAAPADVGRLLDSLASDDDVLWPVDRWPALRLDRPLQVGADGGHGPVRYRVQDYVAGRRVVFRFDPSVGLDGVHALELVAGPGGTLLQHTLEAHPRGAMRVLWPLCVRRLHDALLEDLLDRAERSLGVGPATPARWSAWVRLLHGVAARTTPRPREVAPRADVFELAGLARPDFADAFAVPLPPAGSRDVGEWYDALAARQFLDAFPAWVRPLLAVRTVLARAMRLGTARRSEERTPFTLLARTADAVVTGLDDKHLDFRAVFHVDNEDRRTPRLVMTTVVQQHNAAGRAYFALIRPFHRRVVPALLARLARSNAAPRAGDLAGR